MLRSYHSTVVKKECLFDNILGDCRKYVHGLSL